MLKQKVFGMEIVILKSRFNFRNIELLLVFAMEIEKCGLLIIFYTHKIKLFLVLLNFQDEVPKMVIK